MNYLDPRFDPALADMLAGGVDPRQLQMQALQQQLRGAPTPGPQPMPQPRPQRPQAAPARPQAPQGMAQPPAGPPGGPGAVVDPVMQQYEDLQRRQAEAQQGVEAAYQPVDRSGAEAAYQKQAQQGGQGLLLALAAQEAGMQPIQAHYLKQAAAAREPMKMAGGTMTDTGFVEDPGYAQNLKIQRADAKLRQIDTALQGNISQQERSRLAALAEQARREMQQATIDNQRFLASQSSADRRYAADVAAATSRENARERAAGTGVKTTEDQGKAAGWFVTGRQAMNDMQRVLTEDPGAADPSLTERAAGTLLPKSVSGDVVNKIRTPSRQQFDNAAEAMTDAFLRAATGAGVNMDEAERKRRQLIPQYGDSSEVKAQKLRNYETEMAAIAARAGPALDKLPPSMGGSGGPTPPLPKVAPKAPPQVGEVRGGYTYKGGNPADPASWSK